MTDPGAAPLRPATARDLGAIRALLEANGLPTSDLESSHPSFVVAAIGSTVVGVAGLERYGRTGLLRSLAVASERRGSGIGRSLVRELESAARREDVDELVLLTETAERFFRKLGYVSIDRDSVPGSLQASAEFRSLCPRSACCMSKLIERS